MCYERSDRRRREAAESRELWQDFARTKAADDPEPPVAVEERAAEAREPAPVPER